MYEMEPRPEDEPRLTFDYSHVVEELPGTHMQLMPGCHDSRHGCYMTADLKHTYMCVPGSSSKTWEAWEQSKVRRGSSQVCPSWIRYMYYYSLPEMVFIYSTLTVILQND